MMTSLAGVLLLVAIRTKTLATLVLIHFKTPFLL